MTAQNVKVVKNWFGSFLLNFEINELPLFFPLKISKAAEAILDGFYILGCSFVKYGPIFNFLGSVESWDPEDFKSGLKKTK